MTDQSDYLGSELFQDPEDSPFAPKKVKVTFQCERCSHQWSRIYKAVPADNPPCPKKACQDAALEAEIERRARNMAQIFEEQRGPATIGDKPVNKVIDTTAEMVMTDYGLTDLKDNLRQGDSMAPKLPPVQQRMADNFFNTQGNGGKDTNLRKRMKALGQRAIRGHFRQGALNPDAVHGKREPGERALRSLGPDPSNPFKTIVK